jgi:hypothetical protein
MGMVKQVQFAIQPTSRDQEIDDFARRIDATDNLDYVVLLGHVLLSDQLVEFLGARLRTDTLPKHVPGFELLCGLALAGSDYQPERSLCDLLNRARNTVAHRTHREHFDETVRDFTRAAWVIMESAGFGAFEWPETEDEKVRSFRWAFNNLSLHINGRLMQLLKPEPS